MGIGSSFVQNYNTKERNKARSSLPELTSSPWHHGFKKVDILLFLALSQIYINSRSALNAINLPQDELAWRKYISDSKTDGRSLLSVSIIWYLCSYVIHLVSCDSVSHANTLQPSSASNHIFTLNKKQNQNGTAMTVEETFVPCEQDKHGISECTIYV